ncbi:pentapeptide repeat-containing protein [Nonomuraea sp. NPDC049714]|uniref:pentapeptide repeat-containing protein n=1 Tax=Nonomuraea sp. NPDC049714 TaxID=3364357 RepID=UPI0037BD179D
MKLRRPRLERTLSRPVSAVIFTAIDISTLHLLADGPARDWWQPVLGWLPDYLTPPYSTADLPPMLLTGLVVAGLLFGGIRWIVTRGRPRLRPLTGVELESLQPKERFDALIAERGTRLQRWSTWGVVFGLVFTAGGLVYTASSLETTQEGQITDRYIRAVEQLGSKTIDVRFGAIHALDRLAQDSPRDRVTIANVMAAYVREHDPKPKKRPPEQPTTDVQAALTVLGSVYGTPRAEKGYERRCDCRLARIRIPGADLSFLNLSRANLSRADLRGVDLSSADLPKAILFRADLRGAKLDDTDLTGTDLRRADLRGTDLSEADLTDANLIGAKTNDETKFPPGIKGT